MLRLTSTPAAQPTIKYDASNDRRKRSDRLPKFDINCDLGEGELPVRVRALMRWITSANVACGGHAGGVRSMEYCVRQTRGWEVRLGAHPGFFDRENFGRKEQVIRPAELELLLVQQIGALEKIAKGGNMNLHHIKLHGALYHLVESDSGLATVYVETVERFWPKVKIFASPMGCVKGAAAGTDVTIWEEAFADRAYMGDGSLIWKVKGFSSTLVGPPRTGPLRMRWFSAKERKPSMKKKHHTGWTPRFSPKQMPLHVR